MGGKTARRCMCWINVSAGFLWPVSGYCCIHYTIKNYTWSACSSGCVGCQDRCRIKGEGGRKNPSAGHNFHWQLANKLKQRDTGTIFLSFVFFSLSLSLFLSCCRQLVLLPKIFLEVMDLSGAGTGGRDISLKSGAQQRFSPLFRTYSSAPTRHCGTSTLYVFAGMKRCQRGRGVSFIAFIFAYITYSILIWTPVNSCGHIWEKATTKLGINCCIF